MASDTHHTQPFDESWGERKDYAAFVHGFFSSRSLSSFL
jgi:hypothetical protein